MRQAVLFMEGYGNFEKCSRTFGLILLTAQTLKQVESHLPVSRFRCTHKPYLDNLAHVEWFSGNAVLLGRTYWQDDLRHLNGIGKSARKRDGGLFRKSLLIFTGRLAGIVRSAFFVDDLIRL